MLVSTDTSRTSFAGYVRVRSRTFPVEIVRASSSSPETPFAGAALSAGPDLAKLLNGHEKLLRNRMRVASSPAQMIEELEDVTRRAAAAAEVADTPSLVHTRSLPSAEYFSRLLREIVESPTLGWDRVRLGSSASASSLTSLEVLVEDARGRTHTVYCTLNADAYPDSGVECRVDLPGQPRARIVSPLRLSNVAARVRPVLDKFDDVWVELEDIDRNTWVLEPERPKRSDVFRRIVVARFCSLNVELNLESPRSLCAWRFMGSESVVASLRAKLQERTEAVWDENRSLRKNLESAMEVSFPSPQTSQRSDFATECGICYAYRAGTSRTAPDVVCKNEKCGRPFHSSCLDEWLRALPSVRRSFGTLFGACPYCGTEIAVECASS